MKDDIICTKKYSFRLPRWKSWNWILRSAEVEIIHTIEACSMFAEIKMV
jgi:hypothetical protein